MIMMMRKIQKKFGKLRMYIPPDAPDSVGCPSVRTSNSKAPMPEVVTSSNTFSTVISPPPAAFQQSLRILKRPSSSQSSSSSLATLPSDLQQKSYAEREARYQAARDRIFARTPESSGHNDANPQGRSPSSIPSPNTVVIVRQPRGPEAQPQDDENPTTPSGSNAKAFGRRRGGKSRDSPTPRTQPSFTG